ncbi:uncharacterized protein B0P05DRAFT_532235 [Gilbertella persicaria]|uniref:uncharacterized protein n=1 Tax=Gilbertella persicaria TaxID=101096 RepID=UPI0022209B72|nr:uncharacterized protein B0P05DRAFT_532235 [Gilbertella persicaria]KAI8087766.1 hypothetical protein B0P05DRAFT_532235 [Gilbertella persicaria]
MSTKTSYSHRHRRILIGYDHTQVSNSAMEWIISNRIVFPDDDITLCIIVNDDAITVEGAFGLEASVAGLAGWMADDTMDYRERISKLEKNSKEALSTVVEWFASKGIKVNPEILSGEPGETLKDYAEANQIDLVIVGSRGLGFFKRQLIGSVSDYLMHHLKCSVLVVKDDPERKQ